MIPKAEEETIQEPEPRQSEEAKAEKPDWSKLRGKTIAIFGRLNEMEEVDGIRLIYHDGDRVDWPMVRAARKADVFVILTRWVSHGVMWRLKEFAVDNGKDIYFVRETGTKRILDHIALD